MLMHLTADPESIAARLRVRDGTAPPLNRIRAITDGFYAAFSLFAEAAPVISADTTESALPQHPGLPQRLGVDATKLKNCSANSPPPPDQLACCQKNTPQSANDHWATTPQAYSHIGLIRCAQRLTEPGKDLNFKEHVVVLRFGCFAGASRPSPQ
jgi:hypothetical protein